MDELIRERIRVNPSVISAWNFGQTRVLCFYFLRSRIFCDKLVVAILEKKMQAIEIIFFCFNKIMHSGKERWGYRNAGEWLIENYDFK